MKGRCKVMMRLAWRIVGIMSLCKREKYPMRMRGVRLLLPRAPLLDGSR